MSKDKKNFKCTYAKTCIFTFSSESAIEGPEQNSNLTIVRSKENKELLITVKNNANFTLFSANPIKYAIAQNSGIQEIKVKTTPPISTINAVNVGVKSRRRASLEDDEDDEKQAVQNSCTAIHAPTNRKLVSCYYDSLFFALFAFATPFVFENLFNQKECTTNPENQELCTYLYTIYQKFTTGADAEKCPLPPKYLLPGGLDRMGHDAEVLMTIFSRLHIEPVVHTHDTTYKMAEQSVYDKHVSENKPPLIQLLHHTKQNWLLDENNFILKTDYKFTEKESQANLIGEKKVAYDKEENIQKHNIKDLTFLVIENSGTIRMVEKRGEIIYNENNKIDDINTLVKSVNPGLILNKVTCKSGGAENGHYICYFRCNENWYEYNDQVGITGKKANKANLEIKDGFHWSLLFFDNKDPSI